ncbi:hypothetical protein PR003_g3337 [Phytophthora rubi]|uniref:Uncharacterized protein n=1 Tax=Phytophthora rubi TaxID=129364 RepID=A0A6A4FZ00_9STRA|nr:hypothetical protein PR001_g3440 [Phytophthora rubi]KAE9354465.1 hypothetical protein PR003_g3337 [Phytophthora rubi]
MRHVYGVFWWTRLVRAGNTVEGAMCSLVDGTLTCADVGYQTVGTLVHGGFVAQCFPPEVHTITATQIYRSPLVVTFPCPSSCTSPASATSLQSLHTLIYEVPKSRDATKLSVTDVFGRVRGLHCLIPKHYRRLHI